jgi:outer membrane protein assembly factor BamA
VREASYRLEQVPYLQLSRPPEIGFHPGKASVYLYPQKKGANRFDGWVGLSPDLRAGGKVAFSGALSLDLYNILSQGESWRFNWHRSQDASQQLNLAAHLPYLAGLPVGLQGKFELYRQDTSYLNLSWDAGIPYHFSPLNQVNVFVRHRESNVIVPSADTKTSNRQPFSSFLSGLAWEFNRLDNPVNPYRGLLLKMEASTGRKSIPDSLTVLQSEFLADVSWFRPISRNLTCALILQSALRKSPESFENEQYRVGGLNLMRGFDENVFYADAYAVTSVELRYLLDRSSHILVLADFGFLRTTENGSAVLKTPSGFGIGGQVRTGSGIIRIIFALGKQSQQPLNLKNSKIHLGYVGVF